MSHTFERADARLIASGQHLQHLDPQQVLTRGYSVVRDAAGRIVSNSAAIAAGDRLQLTFARGGAQVEVQETRGAQAD